MHPQVWDMDGPASKEIGGEYHLLLAGNALHNAADLAGERTQLSQQGLSVARHHLQISPTYGAWLGIPRCGSKSESAALPARRCPA